MKTQTKKGFTIIEILIGIFILNTMAFGVYEMYDYSLKMARDKSRKKEAMAIANQEMEYFRNIDYAVLGTASTLCVPKPEDCNLPLVKTVVRNGVNYTVSTDIRYVDDVFDNIGQLDDTGSNDYKTARVEVSWDSTFNNHSIILISTFAPKKLSSFDDCVFGDSDFGNCSFVAD